MRYIRFMAVIICLSAFYSGTQSAPSSAGRDSRVRQTAAQGDSCTKIEVRPWCIHAEMHRTHLHDDEFVGNEVRAYDEQLKIMNRWTRGAFHEALAETATHLQGGPAVCLEDLRKLDVLFPPPRSHHEREVRTTTYAVLLAFYYAEQGGGSDISREKIRVYRDLFTR